MSDDTAATARNSAGAGNSQPVADTAGEDGCREADRHDQHARPRSAASVITAIVVGQASRSGGRARTLSAMTEGFVGILRFELHLPENGSLKGKRKVLLHVKSRLELAGSRAAIWSHGSIGS
jgi:hypothetical protein